jgi:hypothetical protein
LKQTESCKRKKYVGGKSKGVREIEQQEAFPLSLAIRGKHLIVMLEIWIEKKQSVI